jgi:beta-propeller repeat-containing protein
MAMDVDAAGRMFLAGYICEATLPVTANAAQSVYGGGCDGFVAILAPDGRLQYASYLGGKQLERIAAIDADEAGNVYVAGDTTSADFPATSGAYRTTWNGANDAFVTKFSPAGALAYSTFLGGMEIDLALGIAADSAGRAHVVGYTRSPDFPTTPGAVDATPGQFDDAFYARLEPSGAAVSYSTFIAGEGDDYAIEVAVDDTDAAYIAGTTGSGQLPVFMAFQPTPAGQSDGFLMKIAADRTLNYLTYFGGTGRDMVRDITLQGTTVFLAGETCSPDIPNASPRPSSCNGGFIARLAKDGSGVVRTTVVEGTNGWAVAVDAEQRAFLVGNGAAFATTPDAFQPSPDPIGSMTLVMVPFEGPDAGRVQYATYAGRGGPFAIAARVDGAGGVYLGAQFVNEEGHSAFPVVNAPFSAVPAGSAIMHFVAESRMVNDVQGEVVLYAQDASRIAGNWRLEVDPSAALGRKLRNPNGGAPKLGAPLAELADYVEFRFHAEAGVNYRLWMRGRADNDNWANDSVFVQFSDSVDSAGAAVWQIGSTSGTAVNLEDCVNCGVKGWGWQDNGYGASVLGTPVRFASTGMHTLRVQRREDGYAFDQVVLSSSQFFMTSPGPLKEASTVLASSDGEPGERIIEIVLHMTGAETHGAWIKEGNTGAASGVVVRHPDAGAAKVVAMPVPAVNYFELTFNAEAGRAYHLWLRGTAERNYWGNDSVHVQFSDSVDASGAARWRIGSNASTEVNLEDCSGCGLRAWGWQDNGWGVGVSGPPIYFASTGSHVIRVTTREDGFSIDQIVLSAGRYRTASPGALKNDATFLAKTQ